LSLTFGGTVMLRWRQHRGGNNGGFAMLGRLKDKVRDASTSGQRSFPADAGHMTRS
jgi:hypothetical protein